jgi:hypothetical protein
MERMMKTHPARLHPESGLTLLELLLVIGVSAIMMFGVTKLTQSWIETELATKAGSHLAKTGEVVNRFLESKFYDLPVDNTATASVNESIVADVMASTAPVWDDLKEQLQHESLLVGGDLKSPLGGELVIHYTQLADADKTRRFVIYTRNNLRADRVMATAVRAGNVGGSVTAIHGANLVGAMGQWNVPVTDVSGFACAISADNLKGCLVAIVAKAQAPLLGPYLYRTGNANLDATYNTMHADLLMNNYDINDAANVVSDELNVTETANLGTTTVTGTSTFNGPVSATAGMNVQNGMNVIGDATFSNDVIANNSTIMTTNLQADTVQSPEIRANRMDVGNLDVAGGSMVVSDDMDITGNVNVSSGQIYTNTLNAGTVNAGNTGTLNAGSVAIQNSMNVTGNVTITDGPIISDRLVADGCNKILGGPDPQADGYTHYGFCP